MKSYDYSSKWVNTEYGKTLNKKGIRFGKLVAENVIVIDGKIQWNCICDCGNSTHVKPGSLRSSKYGTKSCGCLTTESQKRAVAFKTLDLTGLKFARLTVIDLNSH